MPLDAQDYTTEDFEYLRHGDRGLTARLFRPAGIGPFPLVIDLHGGAWNKGDLTECAVRDDVLAKGGVAVLALDFRQAADGYPSSLVDINYAIRWAKANAKKLGTEPDRIGLSGQSSGGHLAMLAAMKPDEPRYAALELPAGSAKVDATVKCVAMEWPVINPLSRYRNVLALRAKMDTPAWVGDLPERHDIYWGTEAAMEEGNPMLALERGEKLLTPPAVWLQGRPDPVHDYHDPDYEPDLNEPDRFAANYRAAGGEIEFLDVPQASRSEAQSFEGLVPFFRKHLG